MLKPFFQKERKEAGCDEAGRGCLAGPVFAAAVILPHGFRHPMLNDSKQLKEDERELLREVIIKEAEAWAVASVDHEEIDRINILQATLNSMLRAVDRLKVPADFLLIDGNVPVPLAVPQQTLVKGDSRSLSIAAASVIAKVVRDRIMTGYDRIFPGYGFAGHKGYGSSAHLQALARLGPSPCHRRTFGGVREYCAAP